MTTKTVKLIAFFALLVHGIGHFQGVAAGLGLKINKSVPENSWIMKGLNEKTARILCLVLFLATGVFGILSALALMNFIISYSAWQDLATATAVLSTLCLVTFPNGFAMFFNKAGAIAVNLLIYYSIIFNQHWPSVIFDE